MEQRIICQICKCHKVVEETTGKKIKRLEQDTKNMQKPCQECITWVEAD